MPEKIVIEIKPVVTVSPRITVSFPISVTTVVKLVERLVNVVRKNGKV